MKRLQAFRYELKPDGEQVRQMSRFAGSCRFVFHKALALQKERYERGEKKLGYAGLCQQLKAWRSEPETTWLADAPIHPLQQTLKDLERAYSNFFAKRAAFPQFKKKGRSAAGFRYPAPEQIRLDQRNSRVFLPKLGWLRYRNSREVLGHVRNVTVSQRGGKWFISVQTAREVAEPVHSSTSIVGVDVGVAQFATLSDGTIYQPQNSYRKHERRLRHLQRGMARKIKFSNNWKKEKTKVQKLHGKVMNIRRDYLHKTSTAISKNHAVIVIEDLQISNMSKSAAGSTEQPGKNVKAKSGLNKSILDQGWHQFRRQLEYKQTWRGGEVLAVEAKNTSRACSFCAHVAAENRQTQSRFACVACGYMQNADLNAAQNILAAGHAVLACGEDIRPRATVATSAKHEPAEGLCHAA